MGQVIAALILKPEIFDTLIVQKQIPLVRIPMLKNPPSLEVMLAHGPRKRVDLFRNQGVTRLQFSESQMERFLVSVQVLIIKIGILVEPHAEAERRPMPLFVHDDLASFKFRFLGLTQSAASPDGCCLFLLFVGVVGPENCSAGLELGCAE